MSLFWVFNIGIKKNKRERNDNFGRMDKITQKPIKKRLMAGLHGGTEGNNDNSYAYGEPLSAEDKFWQRHYDYGSGAVCYKCAEFDCYVR